MAFKGDSPKVIIIIPTYNKIKYIKECIKSVLMQSYKCFEIVLVDDGSTDGSGTICDEYAANFPFINVIHKDHGGPSSARNFGLDFALNKSNAKYVLFVDADDFIKKSLLKKAVKAIEKTESDILCFGIEMTDEKLKKLKWGTLKIKKNEEYLGDTKFNLILPPQDIGDYAVNKLCKKELFSDIIYPEGRIFEDIYVTYKLFYKAKKVSVIKDNLYLYRRVKNSVTTGEYCKQYFYDIYFACKNKAEYINGISEKFREKAVACLISGTLVAMNILYQTGEEEKYSDLRNVFITEIKNLYTEIETNRYLTEEELKQSNLLYGGLSDWEKYIKEKSE